MPSIQSFALSLLVALLFTGCGAVAPPIQEMTDARLAIAAARDSQAETYATDQLDEARVLLKSAETNLERRAYNAARRDARLAKEKATEARVLAEGKAGKPDGTP